MKVLCRFSIVFVTCWVLVSACAPAPSASPTAVLSAPAAFVRDAAAGISFDRPTDWTRWQPNQFSPMNPGPLIYLSTDPLLPTCATTPEATPNPPDAQGMACDRPLAELEPDGVLVTWLTTRILQRLPKGGEQIEVNGETARWHATQPGSCAVVKADETISVLVPIGQPTPLSNVVVVACLRGPDLAAAESKVRALLASATVGQ